MPITDINSIFDDQSVISGAKNFEQSQPKQQTVFDEPESSQEFDEIENEYEENRTLTESLESYAQKLINQKSVNRSDRLSLESISSTLQDSLPMINGYTQEYSLVNYQPTMESVFSAISKAVSATLKAIWEFISGIFKWIGTLFKSMFTSPEASEKKARVILAKHQELESLTNQARQSKKAFIFNATEFNDTTVSKENHKKIKDILSKKYPNLEITKTQSPIDIMVLLDEMYQSTMHSIYSPIIASVYDNDKEFKNTMHTDWSFVYDKYPILIGRVDKLFKDTKPTDTVDVNEYASVITQIPEPILKWTHENNAHSGKTPTDLAKDFNAMVGLKLVNATGTTVSIPNRQEAFELTHITNFFDFIDWVHATKFAEDFNKVNIFSLKSKVDKDSTATPSYRQAANLVFDDWRTFRYLVMPLIAVNKSLDTLKKVLHDLLEDQLIIAKAYI